MDRLNKYRKYDKVYMDVLMEGISNVFDIRLEDHKNDYLKSEDYCLKYLKYFLLYDNFPKEVREFIDQIDNSESFVFLFLPSDLEGIKEIDIEGSLNELEIQFGKEAKELTKENLMLPINYKVGWPLFFNNKTCLLEFLELKEEDRDHSFSLPVIIFPIFLKLVLVF